MLPKEFYFFNTCKRYKDVQFTLHLLLPAIFYLHRSASMLLLLATKNVAQHFMKRLLYNGLLDLKRLPETKATYAR